MFFPLGALLNYIRLKIILQSKLRNAFHADLKENGNFASSQKLFE